MPEPSAPDRLAEDAIKTLQDEEQVADMDAFERKVNTAKEFLDNKGPELIRAELEAYICVREIESELDRIESE